MAHLLMRPHQLARLGVDLLRELLLEDLLALLHQRRLGETAEGADRAHDEPREADLPHAEARGRGHRLHQLPRRHAAREQPLLEEGDGREAGQEGAVEVEEGRDLGSGRAASDLARHLRVQGHLELHAAQAKRVRDHRHGAQAHGGRGEHGAQQQPEERIQHAGSDGHAERVVEERRRPGSGGCSRSVARESLRARRCPRDRPSPASRRRSRWRRPCRCPWRCRPAPAPGPARR